MAGIDVFFAENGQAITVWFDDPSKEDHMERSSRDLILRKDRAGRVIGYIHRRYFAPDRESAFGADPG